MKKHRQKLLNKAYFTVVLSFFSLLIFTQATNAQETPAISHLSQPSVAIDSPATLFIYGSGFGDGQGEVINTGTGTKLNIGHWYDTEIKIYYGHLVEPNAINVGSNSIKVRTSSGAESAPVNVTGTKCGSTTITSIAPTDIYRDDEVVINGSGFGIDSVNGRAGFLSGYKTDLLWGQAVLAWSDTQIRIKISSPQTGFTGGTNIVVGGRLPDTRLCFSNLFPVTVSYQPRCSADTWDCSGWGVCSSPGTQTRICSKSFDCPSVDTPSPATTQSCSYTPACTSSSWSCGDWSSCSASGNQTRSCSKIGVCEGGSSPIISQSCTYHPPSCISFTYTDWGECKHSYGKGETEGYQNRDVIAQYPAGCRGGSTNLDSAIPQVTQLCTYTPPCSSDTWSCGDWNACSVSGSQTRICNKTFDCSTANTPSPSTTQSCTPPQVYQPQQPSCTADTWVCGNWGVCAPNGVQTRTCSKTYDCSSVQTASPDTAQYCTPPNLERYQVSPADQEVVNQDNIIRATVNLWCPLDETWYQVGSGTIVDSVGTILTNRHVIEDTPGCLVGFVNNYTDEPYFNDRQIADISRVSATADVAVLKLRNLNNRALAYVNFSTGNSDLLRLGDKISTYGYPTKFGTKITSTKGDFSGVEGDYLKTTAIIDKGNSGGGAYLQDGAFIGIPTRVFTGTYNNLGGILSVNKVKSWYYGTPIAYNPGSNNNYSRVSSILENVNLQDLGSFKLYVGDDFSKEQQAIKEQTSNTPQPNTIITNSITKRLLGRILLQVESHGEAWYVSPVDGRRYYMKNGSTAYQMMRSFGLGITDVDLAKIPVAVDGQAMKDSASVCSSNSTASRLKGKILLQVQQHGEAWYVSPDKCRRIYMKDGNIAYQIMRLLSLGITNANLAKIPEGSL